MQPPDTRSFATSQLDRLMGFFPRIDGKASFVLALNVGMLGILALNFPVRDIGSPRGFFGVIAALFLLLSFWQLATAFFPHLKGGDKQSLVYFGDIAAMGWRPYLAAVKTLTEDEFLEDLTCQIWRNSQILDLKFKATQAALKFTMIALPFWTLLLFAATLRAGKFVLSS